LTLDLDVRSQELKASGWSNFRASLELQWASQSRPHPLSAHPERLFTPLEWKPDTWQLDMLKRSERQTIVLCPRQSGKSLSAAAKALVTALTRPNSLSVIISRSQHQAAEVLLKVSILHKAWLGELKGRRLDRLKSWQPKPITDYDLEEADVECVRDNALSKAFENGSRIETFACKGETAVGTTTDLLILDEAARMPDSVYYSVRPTLAIAQSKGKGELVALSTPFGKRGWFYEEWERCEKSKKEGTKSDWRQVSIDVNQCPRITKEFLASEERSMGARWFAQEYGLSFSDAVDSVFSHDDIERAMKPRAQSLIMEEV
jgi:hypothetical protein